MASAQFKSIKYITVGEDMKNWGLYITGAGSVKVCKNMEYPLVDDPAHHYFHFSAGRRLPEYQILYITKGKGVFESEVAGVRKISAGDIFILSPGVWHKFKPDKRIGWDEYWVEFNGKLINHCQVKEILNPENPVIKIGVHSELSDYYLQILQVMKEEKPGFQHIASGNLFQIFAYIFAMKKYHVFKGKMIENQIEQAKLYINENLSKSISQTKVSLEVGLGYSLYRKKFREYTSLSPCQYQIQLRINKAKELLVNTDMTLFEIGNNLGFDSNDYFCRLFKKKVGLTPSEYKKKNM